MPAVCQLSATICESDRSVRDDCARALGTGPRTLPWGDCGYLAAGGPRRHGVVVGRVDPHARRVRAHQALGGVHRQRCPTPLHAAARLARSVARSSGRRATCIATALDGVLGAWLRKQPSRRVAPALSAFARARTLLSLNETISFAPTSLSSDSNDMPGRSASVHTPARTAGSAGLALSQLLVAAPACASTSSLSSPRSSIRCTASTSPSSRCPSTTCQEVNDEESVSKLRGGHGARNTRGGRDANGWPVKVAQHWTVRSPRERQSANRVVAAVGSVAREVKLIYSGRTVLALL
jgi:hypothetical protein